MIGKYFTNITIIVFAGNIIGNKSQCAINVWFTGSPSDDLSHFTGQDY